MIINKYFSIFFLVLSITAILFLTLVPAYYSHLRVDIYGQYINHVNAYLNDGSLSDLGYNEYQPVAVMFFVALSPFYTSSNYNINQYIYGLYLVNILLILVSAFLIYKIKNNYSNIFIFALILLFTGPIILNRFELLVFVLLLISIFFFTRRYYFWSGIFLAISIFTKIYPIVFAPYLLYIVIKNRRSMFDIFKYILGGLVGSALVLFVFCTLLGANPTKILTDINIHQIKPVHAESTWATLITLLQWNNTHNIAGGSVGIFGIREEFIIFPKMFYNFFWIGLILIYYLYIFIKNYSTKILHFENGVLYILALAFLVASKILTPQYTLWFSLLFTLLTIPITWKKQFWWSMQLFLILLISVLTQFIYPLNYEGLVVFYDKPDGTQMYFWILALRNILLIVLLFISLAYFRFHRKKIKITH